MLSTDPGIHKLARRLVAEGGVATCAVVEPLDVVEHVSRSRLPGGVPGAMHPLVLQAVEEALGGRVIPAVALAAHGTDHAVAGELLLEGLAGVLAAPIGVVQQPP